MTQPSAPREGPLTLVARLVTEVLAPVVLVFALLIVVAVHATRSWAEGLGLGLLLAFFAAGLPYLILLAGIRTGRLSDRHLRDRRERPAMMAIGLVSVAIGLLIAYALNTPHEVFALVAAMVSGVAVALAITTFWKISIHTACAAGTVAVLVHTFGYSALWAIPVVLLVAWARLQLHAHDLWQITAGAVVGYVVASVVITLA